MHLGLEHGQAADSLDRIVIGRLAEILAVAPEAEQVAVDEARIDGRNGLVGEAELGDRRRPDRMHQHIACRRDPQAKCPPLGRRQIDPDALLAGIEIVESARHAGLPGRPEVADDVALRALELDDGGAELRQDERAVGSHHHGCQVEDTQAGKRRPGSIRIRCVVHAACFLAMELSGWIACKGRDAPNGSVDRRVHDGLLVGALRRELLDHTALPEHQDAVGQIEHLGEV